MMVLTTALHVPEQVLISVELRKHEPESAESIWNAFSQLSTMSLLSQCLVGSLNSDSNIRIQAELKLSELFLLPSGSSINRDRVSR
jgi:hypothetical protein